MSDLVTRALVIKPGGLLRQVTITVVEGIVNLNYSSQKVLQKGSIVSIPLKNLKASSPRRTTILEEKLLANVTVNEKKIDTPAVCFDVSAEDRSYVILPM